MVLRLCIITFIYRLDYKYGSGKTSRHYKLLLLLGPSLRSGCVIFQELGLCLRLSIIGANIYPDYLTASTYKCIPLNLNSVFLESIDL